MKRFLATLAVLALCVPALALAEPEIKSRAKQITITGRVHAQWFQSSIDTDPSNEFFLRRARATVKVKMNDMWSGEVQPEFGRDGLSLKDAFVRAHPKEGLLEISFGQTKRPFDLFELTSSTEILVIERDGRIGRRGVVSLSRLTERLGYSDRDIGMFVGFKPKSKRYNIYGGVSNGTGANLPAQFSNKAYQGRLSVTPLAWRKWQVFGGVSTRPYHAAESGGNVDKEKYATAYELSTELGSFDQGGIAQAGLVTGHNWNGEQTDYDRSTDFTQSPPTFVALQGIVAYTLSVRDNGWCKSVRPGIRVSWADPNTDDAKGGTNDEGLVITPAFDFVNDSRNRVAINVDIFKPQTGDTEFSAKVQSFLYW
jgi:hypothetical protein